MKLTQEEQDIFVGKKGPVIQKIIKSVVQFGNVFGAKEMVIITGPPHFVISMGTVLFGPYFDMIDEIIQAGLKTEFYTAEPRPVDHKNIKSNLLGKSIFRIFFNKQAKYEKQMIATGMRDTKAFTCACYLDEVGNLPRVNDI